MGKKKGHCPHWYRRFYASRLEDVYKRQELNITNEIDTSAANEIFNPALETIGSLNYTTENQVANGEILVVEDSAGYLHTSDKQVFHSLSSFNGMSSTVDQDQNAEVLC